MCEECRRLIKLWFITALIFYVISAKILIPVPVMLFFTILPVMASIGIWIGIVEVLSVFIPVIFLSFFTNNLYAVFLPVFTSFFIILAHRSDRMPAVIISYLYLIFLTYISIIYYSSIADILLIAVSILNMVINIKLFNKRALDKDTCMLYNADSFFLYKKIEQNINHLFKEQKWQIFKQDSIPVDKNINITFFINVSYCNISIKELKNIWNSVPYGAGKNVFIVYSADFFSDIAYISLYILLFFKRYKVQGRLPVVKSMTEIKTANIWYAVEQDIEKEIISGIKYSMQGHTAGLPAIIPVIPFGSIIGSILKLFLRK